MTPPDTPAARPAADLPPLALFESFERIARAKPGRMVIRSAGGGVEMNAAALLDRVGQTARALGVEGVGPGQLVVLQGLSGTPFVVGILAVWAKGAAALAADPQLAGRELAELRGAFRPHASIRSGAGRDLLAEAIPRDPDVTEGLPPIAAVIKLTSGSTGRPRGIAATASQLMADARHIADGMRSGEDDLGIAAVPMSHSYGMASLLLQLVTRGSPLLMVPGPLPDLLAAALSVDEPAHFPGVPYLFELLARPGGPAVRRRGLIHCLSAAAPLRPATAAAFAARVGAPVRSFYGTSETGGISFDASPDGGAALTAGCVGTPLPGVRVTVEGDESRLVVRGGNVGWGYVAGAVTAAAAGETAAAAAAAAAAGSPPGNPPGSRPLTAPGNEGEFRDGAFRTGDTGAIDAQGRIHLTGRIGSLVNVSGRKIDPREIERALAALPGVEESAALGISDGSRGEALVAFVTPSGAGGDRLTRARVMSHLRDRLAPFKIPRRVIFVDEMPRSPRGKLDRDALRRLAMEGMEGSEHA